MSLRDWSSDVCSSDLHHRQRHTELEGLRYVREDPELGVPLAMMALAGMLAYEVQVTLPVMEIGRASCREREEDSVVDIFLYWQFNAGDIIDVRVVSNT